MSEARLKLSTDFDGTAVEKLPMTSWKNWFKADLGIMIGFPRFLRGAQDGGLGLDEIISRRNLRIRWGTTAHSIVELGLSPFFTEDQVKLLGSEAAKAVRVDGKRAEEPGAMLDDQPGKLGKEVFKLVEARRKEEYWGALRTGEKPPEPWMPEHELIIGAVWHPEREKRLQSLTRAAENEKRFVVEPEPISVSGLAAVHYPDANLTVVRLHPYSYDEGQRFAEFALQRADAA